jgi:hypothetical protein
MTGPSVDEDDEDPTPVIARRFVGPMGEII